LELLGLTSTNCTIVSMDAQDYCPSVHFRLVWKAVQYYSQTLSLDLQDTIDECLEMIRFGMKSTLITFQDRFFEYDGRRTLMIVDLQSAGMNLLGWRTWLEPTSLTTLGISLKRHSLKGFTEMMALPSFLAFGPTTEYHCGEHNSRR
jgi:hypothetical protein